MTYELSTCRTHQGYLCYYGQARHDSPSVSSCDGQVVRFSCCPKMRMLGLIIETTNLMVGIPPDYVAEVLDLLNTTWHSHHRHFTVGEAQKLSGILDHLAEGAHWVVYLLTHLYTSITYALTQNKCQLVDTSPEFHNIFLSLNW